MSNSSRLYQTPRTRLAWRSLSEWVTCAYELDARRASRLRAIQCSLHVRALPLQMVWHEDSIGTLQAALGLLTGHSGFRQPARGKRADAPHTPLISAIKNRIKRLESAPDG